MQFLFIKGGKKKLLTSINLEKVTKTSLWNSSELQ